MSKFENFAVKLRHHQKLRRLRVWDQIRGIYLFLLKVITLNRGLLRTLYPGVVVRVSYASRHTMSADYLTTKQWDVPCLDLIHRWTIRNSDTCFFDVGANHGQFSLVVSRWLDGTGKKVYAFEPQPTNLKVLQENLKRNNCTNVEVVGLALAARTGKMTLYGEEVTASLQSSDDDRQEHVVDVETLDAFCDQIGVMPNIIKIDVEGLELDVLRGGIKTLTQHQENIRVICEMHTFMWADQDYDLALIKLVKSCGLNIFALDGTSVERITEYGHYVLAKRYI